MVKMTGQDSPVVRGKGGRPSLAGVRRLQILNAFIALVAKHGLEAVTLENVAEVTGLKRSVVRHFAGNRAVLIAEAVRYLTAFHVEALQKALKADPSIPSLLNYLFDPHWREQSSSPEDLALDAFVQEAVRSPQSSATVREFYEALIEVVARLLAKRFSTTSPETIHTVAYNLVCLSEHDGVLRAMQLPLARAGAARHAAEVLIATLSSNVSPKRSASMG
jgi:AcrR family transcriptional regulator